MAFCPNLKTSNIVKMKLINTVQPFELWLLENVFQKFSDFTYHWFRLSNFFWASCCFIVSCFAFLWTAYMGIMIEHDPLMILAMFVMVVIFIIPSLHTIKKAWFAGYDDAIYGLENSLKNSDASVRAEALIYTIIVIAIWAVISFHHKKPHLDMLLLWTSMMQYPTRSFCSCTPPGRRFN